MADDHHEDGILGSHQTNGPVQHHEVDHTHNHTDHESSHSHDNEKGYDHADPDAPDALPVFTISPPPIGRQYSQTTTYSSVVEESPRRCDECCTIL